MEAGRHLGHRVAMAHPEWQLEVEPFKQRGRLADGEQRGTVLVGAAEIDLAAQVVGDELHPIADTEHGNPGAERFQVDLGRVFLVDARGPSAEDQSRRLALLQLRPWRRPGHELAVNLGLSHTASDQLAELRTEIQDQHGLWAHGRRGVFTRPGSRGSPAQLSLSPYPRAATAGVTCPQT